MSVSSRTAVVGLLGYPVVHSFSPYMHNAAFRALGMDWVYLAFNVEPRLLPAAVSGIRALGFRGVNVTIPHKQAILPFLDEIDPLAKLIGAVNTVVVKEGKLVGYNTDASGFWRSLKEEGVDPRGKRALILGAGGAARAVAYALVKHGCNRLYIANRTYDRARELAETLKKAGETSVEPLSLEEAFLASILPEADLIINTTSVGMETVGGELPITADKLEARHIIYDLVYNPPYTKLLKMASSKGCRAISGRSMLLYQGAEAFTLWTGREAPLEVMKQVVEELLPS
ncbi:MAG: shikimate dehydrogenase [Thermanaeromonas sp.]|uniref:shikimate dehydrogenase n=1 Tax=Thermanaeromonas sp. TaxID=2003697 RepID=UPI00243E1415|nr:shikimate dehydrogenase [Thermanaeromonas sp.]MCG0278416.1 shikimate dehydrogenase [Thermanaeromonas sp.]